MHALFRNKVTLFGAGIIIILAVVAIFAPQIGRVDPTCINIKVALLPPSLDHILGTDSLGRDLFSRMVHATRVALLIGFIAVGLAAAIGVFLGSLAGYFGGKIDHASEVMHGKPSKITHTGKGVFDGLENPLQAGRYHSLCAVTLPDCLEQTANFEGIVMGVQHKTLPIHGVQFHPESILTPTGGKIIENIMKIASRR